MGRCNLSDHIAGAHIHMHITTYNIEDHNRSNALERLVIDYFGAGGLKQVLQDPNPRPLHLR